MNPAKQTQAVINALIRQRNAANNRIVELEAELTVLQEAHQELQAKVEDAQDASAPSDPEGPESASEPV